MSDKIWVETPEGEAILVGYDELDPEILGQFCRPTGKFSYSVTNFLNLPLPETPFYIKDWLPIQGKLEVYGQRKAGKSFLAVQLARCIAAGEPFLGRPTRRGRVLYLQFELGTSILQSRIKHTQQEYDDVFVGTTYMMKLDKSSGQGMIYDELDTIHPQVLILDPLYKILSGDENEAKDVLIVLDFLDGLLDIYSSDQLSIVIFHHAGKELVRGGRGSSVLDGWVDSCIELRQTGNGEETLHARITPKFLRHSALSKPIDIVLADNFEFQLGEAAQSVQDKVVQFFQQKHRARMQDIVDAGIGSRRSVYDARKRLIDEGFIEDVGNGFYQIKEVKINDTR